MTSAPTLSEGTADGTAGPPRGSAPGFVVRVLVAAVRGYQLVRAGRPSGCRFLPSCSEYTIEALRTHGVWRGVGLAARRILRCHPWGGHGIDPVPGEGA
jgi:putative membrane protein insertion efficiency factor